MADKLRNTIARFAIIFLLIMMGFVGVVSMILYIQTSPTEKAKWSKIEATQVQTNLPIAPTRGNILDANGNLLASSLPQYVVYMDTRVEALHLGGDTLYHRYIDSIANGLSRIIQDKTPAEYKKMINTAFYSKSKDVRKRDIRLHRGRINYVQKQQLQQLPLIKRGVYKSGIHFDEKHKRKKPFGRLGSRTIGTIYGEDGVGNAGLEKSYETRLHGKEGISTRMRVAGYWTNVPVKEAKNGDDIVTTLDVNLMDICETTLEEKLQEVQGDWGCVLLMETHTGQIKAIINLDRNPADGQYYEMMNHAVTRVEPGSTFKTIAMMAALDDGKITINDTFYVHSNGWDYFSLHHSDSHPKDTCYTVRSALAISSNIALAKMITKSYDGKADKFVNKLDKMGITRSFETDIPGSTPPRIDVPNDAVTISKMAYGYSVELSPMQILAFYNGIANNGKVIRPYLVSRIEHNGETLEKFDTEVLQSSLCSRKTLEDVRSALHDVVWDNKLGTASVRQWGGRIVAYKAQSDLVHIAGKTGTAQLFHHGHYHNHEHRMTFVGYFPEEDPQYTCLCMIENPKNYPLYDAGYDCGSVVRKIAERTMAYGWVYEYNDGQMIFKKR